MPKDKIIETIVGPVRKFCSHAYKEKAVFPNYKAALNFLQDHTDNFTRHMGTFAKAVYYCPNCKGWHLTKHIPAFDDDFPGFDGVIINGVVYIPETLGDSIEACYVCDEEVVKRCHKGNFMPCLAYKGNVCMKHDNKFLLMKRIKIDE